jgi:iron-sulfur cluster assembly accessory protein
MHLTEQAAAKVRALLEREGRPQAALRLRVAAGGCSGLRYELTFDDFARESDREFERHGVRLLVDAASAVHLVDCTLDHADGLKDSGFTIANPNATSSCGCGESFGV